MGHGPQLMESKQFVVVIGDTVAIAQDDGTGIINVGIHKIVCREIPMRTAVREPTSENMALTIERRVHR